MCEDGERATITAFVAGSVLAGGNGVAIRFSNRELDWLWGAGLRFVLAALLMLCLMAALGVGWPRGRALAGAVVYGLLQFAATFALTYYALVELHAGFGQILLALVPLLTFFLAFGQRQERFRLGALGGAVLALAGVVVMSSAALEGSLPLLSVGAAVASALCFAEAAVLVRWLPRVHPVAMNAVGMTAGAIALVLAAVIAAIITAPSVIAEEKGIALVPLGVYQTFRFDEGAVEISAYDPATSRAFATFAEQPYVEAIDLSNVNTPALAFSIDLTPWGGEDAHATSVSVSGGVLAVAVPQGEEDTAPGKVLFFTTSGVYLSEVTVGALPDMLTFSPDGRMVLSANEGQPMSDYSFDPEGSVSIIDMSGGAASLTNADVTTVGFSAFNNAPIDPRIRIFGPGSTVAQDLEPEYLAVSHDSRTAWVTLQENNAIAIVDLVQKKVTELVPLGYKDHTRPKNGLDGGRDDGGIHIKRWPLLGMFLPDAIAAFRDNNNQTYLVTANEGDARDYAGFAEDVRKRYQV
jgi:drug/metabolite transporter (DMT)-like permease